MTTEISNSQDIMDTNYYSLIEAVVSYIKDSGLKIGDRLPNESVLARYVMSNRSTLREILRVLEAFGVITSKRGSGNIYTCDLEIGMMNLFMISNALLDNRSMDINNLRAVIEAEAIELFIKNATDYDVFMLEMIYNEQMKMVRDKKTHKYLECHILFHDQLMKYYPNQIAKQLCHSGIRLIDHGRTERFNAGERDLNAQVHGDTVAIVTHEELLQAIKAKDILLAKSLMVSHILIPGEILETY